MYTKRERLSELAAGYYKETGYGITFQILIRCGIAKHKSQAQTILKHGHSCGVLFTLTRSRPQMYYPVSLRSEIMTHYTTKIIQKGVTGASPITKDFASGADEVICNSLVGYVLPLLSSTPMFIHNLHLKTKLPPDVYDEIYIEPNIQNRAKKIEEIIGSVHVVYLFYPNGTVNISTENSNNPLKLDSDLDRSRIFAFFGQIRDRLIQTVSDIHERFVPDIILWELSECDINKDIPVSHWMHASGLRIQIKHFDHLFRIYIKSMKKDTVCRIEDCKSYSTKPAIEIIHDIFNPNERTNELLLGLQQEILQVKSLLEQ